MKVLLGFYALQICGSLSIDCLKLRILCVVEMLVHNMQYFFLSLEYDIQGFKAIGSQVKSLRISSWLTMIIMCCAFSASNCPKTRKHSSKWAARLELRV